MGCVEISSKPTKAPLPELLQTWQIRKFKRALAMPGLLTLSRDLGANGGNHDDDIVVDPRFGIRGKSISGHTRRQASRCQISRG